VIARRCCPARCCIVVSHRTAPHRTASHRVASSYIALRCDVHARESACSQRPHANASEQQSARVIGNSRVIARNVRSRRVFEGALLLGGFPAVRLSKFKWFNRVVVPGSNWPPECKSRACLLKSFSPRQDSSRSLSSWEAWRR